MNVAWPLRIWYDRSCPLCRAELHGLQEHDARGRLQLVDCSPADFNDAELGAAGVTRGQAMAFIHARDANGRWLRGIEVFEAAYAAVGIEGMARLFAHPWLRPGWDRLYPWVARNRQWLSRTGLTRPFGWLVRRAARRAEARARACHDGTCDARG